MSSEHNLAETNTSCCQPDQDQPQAVRTPQRQPVPNGLMGYCDLNMLPVWNAYLV